MQNFLASLKRQIFFEDVMFILIRSMFLRSTTRRTLKKLLQHMYHIEEKNNKFESM